MRIEIIKLKIPPNVEGEDNVEEIRDDISNLLGVFAEDVVFNPLDALVRTDELAEVNKDLHNGRDYLMGVQPNELSVEDALEAFGFGRNGLLSK